MYYSLPLNEADAATARFVSRPNRFLVWCEHPRQGLVKAFLPNPGRLSELLLPDVSLRILHVPDAGGARATAYTVLAVERDGCPVMLHTHWCNDMARRLLEDGAVPGLEQARIVRQEASVGRSRFDFLLEDPAGKLYLEVKSCTLFGNGVAMFPDAVTERGRRHLLELGAMAEEGLCRGCVLFLVQSASVSWFMPDFHTDPDFARAMLAVRDKVRIMALPVTWDAALRYQPGRSLLPIPWEHIDRETQDRGAYVVIMKLSAPRSLDLGGLGVLDLPSGHYLYIGSAMRGLKSRLARHGRKRKRMHWHVDYLLDAAEAVELLPIRSSRRLECAIARDLSEAPLRAVRGFGCSDCTCESHLYHGINNPMNEVWFHALLQRWRMRAPER